MPIVIMGVVISVIAGFTAGIVAFRALPKVNGSISEGGQIFGSVMVGMVVLAAGVIVTIMSVPPP